MQMPHPNSAIDAMELETRLVAKHNITPVVDSEIAVLPGKTQTKPFVASSQLRFLDGSSRSLTPL